LAPAPAGDHKDAESHNVTSKRRDIAPFDDTRAKKAISQLVAQPIDHGMGKIELTPVQARSVDVAISAIEKDAEAPIFRMFLICSRYPTNPNTGFAGRLDCASS
jgi:hypothetical protein